MTYRAPVKTIRFFLDHIVDFGALSRLDAFADLSPDVTEAVLGEAARLTGEVMAPLNATGDQEGARRGDDGSVTTPKGYKEAYRQWVDGGWGSIPFDPDYGGQGLPRTLMLAIQDMMQGANPAFGLAPLLTQGAIEALTAHGSQDLKDLYLSNLISGEWSGAMCLTEPQAGSDVGALRAKAEKRPDGTYAITGTKIFITYGEHDMAENIIHLVLARLPDAPEGTRGISLFLVPKILVNPDGSLGARNDVICAGIEHKLGIHGSPTCTMAFGEKGGATGYLIGAENRGMAAMFTMMNNARLNVGIQGVGVSEAAFQKALDYARERRQGTPAGVKGGAPVPIIEHPDVQRMLWTMKAYTDASRAICYANALAADLAAAHPDEAMRADAKAREELLTPISKAFSTDIGVEVANLGIQVHGGMGFIEETGAAQFLRDARIFPIYEGTNGIQANDLVARKLPMEGGKVLERLVQEMSATARDCQTVSDARFDAMGAALKDGISAVNNASQYLLGVLREAPNDALAGAAAYLRLLGTVAGGHFLAKGALAAHEGKGSPDKGFLENRIAIAHFYASTIMPCTGGLAVSAMRGADVLRQVREESIEE